MGKIFWRSKTFWLNALGAVVFAATFLDPIVSDLEVLGLPEDVSEVLRSSLAIVLAFGNLVLRSVTTEPVRFK